VIYQTRIVAVAAMGSRFRAILGSYGCSVICASGYGASIAEAIRNLRAECEMDGFRLIFPSALRRYIQLPIVDEEAQS